MSDEQHRPVLAVDFDGTLCTWAFPDCGEPRPEIVKAVQWLHEHGWRVIIHSCRVNSHWPEPERTEKTAAMMLWLIEQGIPFDDVWGVESVSLKWVPGGWSSVAVDNGDPISWRFTHQTGKPVADVYLDDRALFAGLGREKPPSIVQSVEWLVSECERVACTRAMGMEADDSNLSGEDADDKQTAPEAAPAAEQLPLPGEGGEP